MNSYKHNFKLAEQLDQMAKSLSSDDLWTLWNCVNHELFLRDEKQKEFQEWKSKKLNSFTKK